MSAMVSAHGDMDYVWVDVNITTIRSWLLIDYKQWLVEGLNWWCLTPLNPLVPCVAYLLHELLRSTNSKINVCFVFFPSVECLRHCKVIIRYRNIVIITFCGYFLFSRKCQPPWNMSGKNITDGKIQLHDHTDNNRSTIWFFR